MSSSNEKKILLGSMVAISILGTGAIASIIAGAVINNQNNKAIQDAKNKALADKMTSAKKQVFEINLDEKYSLISTDRAKLSFNVPADLTGQMISVRYRRVANQDDLNKNNAISIKSQFITKSPQAKIVTFFLDKLSSNYKYEYDVVVGDATKLVNSFVTKFRPEIKAETQFRSFAITVSGLASYQNRTLILKAIPTSKFQVSTATESFKNTNLLQPFNIPAFPESNSDSSLTFTFNPAGLDDDVEYTFMLFDAEGLLPLFDITGVLPKAKTAVAGLQIDQVYGYINTASMRIQGLSRYKGTKLNLLISEVKNKDDLFVPSTARKITLTPQNGNDALLLNITDLTPDKIYKYNVYAENDSTYNEPIFADSTQKNKPDQDKYFNTHNNPVINEVEDSKANPSLEARAALLKINNIDSFKNDLHSTNYPATLSSLRLKVAKKTANVSDWSAAGIASFELTVPTTTSGAEAKKYVEAKLLNLEPSTEYVYQLIGGDNKTTLLKNSGSFTTLAGFSESGVKIDIPLDKSGQKEVSLTLDVNQLEQFDLRLASEKTPAPAADPVPTDPVPTVTATADSSSSDSADSSSSTAAADTSTAPADSPAAAVPTKEINKLDVKYIAVTSDEEEVDWNSSEVKKSTINLTEPITSSSTNIKLSDLKEATKYKLVVFMGEHYLAPVSQVYTFETNTQPKEESIATNNKVVILFTDLKTYVGKELEVVLTEKNISDSVFKKTVKFTPNASGNEVIQFNQELQEGKDYEFKLNISVPNQTADSTPTTHELLKKDIKTATASIEGEIPYDKINPTSVLFKLKNLAPLKGKSGSVVYRPKTTANDGQWSKFDLKAINVDTINQVVLNTDPGLNPETEYEFNIVWNNAPEVLLMDSSISATTKKNISLQSDQVKQTTARIKYSDFAAFKDQTLVLKYWAVDNSEVTNQLANSLRSQTPTGTVSVTIPKNGTDTTVSVLTGLSPEKNYAYRLFNGDISVSELKTFKTQNQLKVKQTKTYASAVEITFTHLDTLTETAGTELKVIAFKFSDNSKVGSELKFTANTGLNEQKVLLYDLTLDNPQDELYFQVFPQTTTVTDGTTTGGVITTDKATDKRKFTLLNQTNLPAVKVAKVSNTSVLLELTQLRELIDETLIVKYRTEYWDASLSKTVVVEKSLETVVAKSELNVVLTDLLKNKEYSYEFYVKVGNDTENVPLTKLLKNKNQRPKFHTTDDVKVVAEKTFVLPKQAEIYFKGINDKFKGQKLVLKALPKSDASNENAWKDSRVISSEITELTPANGDTTLSESTEHKFTLKNLQPNTEYIYQLFVEGLDSKLLTTDATFKTRDVLKLEASELATTTTRLLLSNATTYEGQKLVVRYWKASDYTSNKSDTTKYKDVEVTIQEKSEFTNTTLFPVDLTTLEAGNDYVFEVYSYNGTNVDPTNLLTETLRATTLTKDVQPLVVSNATQSQAKIYLTNLGRLAGHKFVLSWKLSTETAYSTNNKIEFEIPTGFDQTLFEVPSPLTGLATTGEYYLELIPNFETYNLSGGKTNLLESNAKFNVAKITPKVSDKSTFTDKNSTLASTILGSDLSKEKEQLEAKFDLSFGDGYTIEFQNSTTTNKKNSANDLEGKLIIKVLIYKTSSSDTDSSSNKTKALEYTLEIDGFKKSDPDQTPEAPVTPSNSGDASESSEANPSNPPSTATN
ncbi:hypothetical protein NV226_02665 [Mycoplasma iguanae]|uniref:Fibronectin type-III domain-containing protein n=1 Tax=Mycoplasma iguanae TaxID=292461 RepID=A0ABY5R8V5_9MOLU|nr:hypothetical protein [Mycoplasma iguanae]UVD81602.1 hypothetical protein NV226_02665 [Mycoplasma iguanae]